MTNLFDDVKKNLKEWGSLAADKAEELTKVGRLKIDILSLNREIEKNFVELGGKVYELIYKEDQGRIKSNDEVKKIIQRIATFEETREEKINEIRDFSSDDDIDVESVKKESK